MEQETEEVEEEAGATPNAFVRPVGAPTLLYRNVETYTDMDADPRLCSTLRDDGALDFVQSQQQLYRSQSRWYYPMDYHAWNAGRPLPSSLQTLLPKHLQPPRSNNIPAAIEAKDVANDLPLKCAQTPDSVAYRQLVDCIKHTPVDQLEEYVEQEDETCLVEDDPTPDRETQDLMGHLSQEGEQEEVEEDDNNMGRLNLPSPASLNSQHLDDSRDGAGVAKDDRNADDDSSWDQDLAADDDDSSDDRNTANLLLQLESSVEPRRPTKRKTRSSQSSQVTPTLNASDYGMTDAEGVLLQQAFYDIVEEAPSNESLLDEYGVTPFQAAQLGASFEEIVHPEAKTARKAKSRLSSTNVGRYGFNSREMKELAAAFEEIRSENLYVRHDRSFDSAMMRLQEPLPLQVHVRLRMLFAAHDDSNHPSVRRNVRDLLKTYLEMDHNMIPVNIKQANNEHNITQVGVGQTRMYDRERCNRSDPAYLAPFDLATLREVVSDDIGSRVHRSEGCAKFQTEMDAIAGDDPNAPRHFGNCLLAFSCQCSVCSAATSMAATPCLLHPVGPLQDRVRLSFLLLPHGKSIGTF